MNKIPTSLFAPVGEVTPAGGASASAVPAIDSTSHLSDAAALFADKAPEPAAPAELVAPAVKPKEEVPPDDKSIFDAIKPKPAGEAAKPAPIDNPEDKIALDPKAKPDTVKHFDSLKAIARQVRAEAEQLRVELAEAKKTPAVSLAAQQEVEKLRADHKAAMDKLAVVDLKNHPSYVQQFVAPLNAAVESVKSILTDNGMAAIDVPGLLAKPRAEFAAAVNEIAGKLPAFDQASFVQEMRNMRTLDGKASEALKNAGTLAGEIQQQQTAKARTAFNETLTSLDFVKAGGLGLVEIPASVSPEDRVYFEAYNASAASIPAEAEKIVFGGMGDKDVARTGIEAATFRHVMKHVIPRVDYENQQAKKLIGELTSAIKELRGSAAAAGSDNSSAPASGGAKQLHEMGNEEAAAHLWGK